MKISNFKKPLTLCALLMLLTASRCKEDPIITPPPAENNITTLAFPSTKYNVVTVERDRALVYKEMGFKFTVNKAGKVTKLGVKMPDAGLYRVVLWDADTKSQMASAYLPNNDYQDIYNGKLIPNKNYYITVSTIGQRNYEVRSKSGSYIFPIKMTNSITLISSGHYGRVYSYDNGITPKFPEFTDYYYVEGFPEFEFQPD